METLVANGQSTLLGDSSPAQSDARAADAACVDGFHEAMRVAFDATPVPLLILEPRTLGVVHCNTAAGALVSDAAQQALWTLTELFQEGAARRIELAAQDVASERMPQARLQARCAGSERWVEITLRSAAPAPLLVAQVRPLTPSEPDTAAVHSSGQFAAILQRERARTDRSGQPFSLLVFSRRTPPDGADPLAPLARKLKRRLRITDEVGWLPQRRLAALLPATDSDGARHVVRDLLPAWPQPSEDIACNIYVYPSACWPQTSFTPQEIAAGDEPVQPMEPLFVQRLPLWKRGLDVIGASLGLVLLLPLLAAVAAAIKIAMPGPVLFRQLRSGLGGRPFYVYKFRTMVVGAEAQRDELLDLNEQDGPAFKIARDPRVTRLGAILRKTSIDELPQLWNVLLGDMSLVGPRPLPCREAQGCALWQRRRLDATPGLTCTWQVHGRSRVSFQEWMRMDLCYLRRRTPGRDLLLLLQTLPAVILGRGAK